MTATELSFLQDLKDSQVTYVDNVCDQMLIGDPKLLSLKKIKTTLLAAMLEVIDYWFRDTTDSDDNFFDTDEIQDVIDHANKIMGTTHYIDLSGY